MQYSDLVVDAFLALRDSFFDSTMQSIPFALREKRITQDDPLDEHICKVLKDHMGDATCQESSGPLISPDLVVYRSGLCNGQPRQSLRDDTTRIAAIEVKKLERSPGGPVPRSTGLDYNTTPPCGTVRVYAADDSALDIKGFYLFVALEPALGGQYATSALALCDGDIINADFDLYLNAVGQRKKKIGLGTYGNGLDRVRPMFVFANPLGASELDKSATLVTRQLDDDRVGSVYRILRKTSEGTMAEFFAYRRLADIPEGWEVQSLKDPFPRPRTRGTTTQRRGRFRMPIQVK